MFRRFFADNFSEIASFVGGMFGIVVVLWDWYVKPLKECLPSTNCLELLVRKFDYLDGLQFFFFILGVGAVMGAGIFQLVRGWRRTQSYPVGYWVAEVSPVIPGEEREFSLAQILPSEKGGFEYRGVGRGKSARSIEFLWQARDAWVQPARDLYRFVFRTLPDDIPLKPETMPRDTANIGFIDYRTNGREPGRGDFFDFSQSGVSVTRKRITLHRYDLAKDKDAEKCFKDFFEYWGRDEFKRKMGDVLAKIERSFLEIPAGGNGHMQPSVQRHMVVSAICIGLNVGLGKVSNLLALPFTMDTIGTILGAAILPWPFLLAAAALSSVVAFVVINPAFIFFIGTQIVIALIALALLAVGMFQSLPRAVLAGLLIGVCSAIVSAPVTVIVFGGVAVPSISALNAVFLASGQSLWASVLSGSMIVESIDKMAAGTIAWYALRRLPSGMRA